MSIEKLNDLISKIRYQLPIGVTTWGDCANTCGNSARGSAKCIECLEKELADIVGNGKAFNFVCNAIDERNARAEMQEHIEDLDNT